MSDSEPRSRDEEPRGASVPGMPGAGLVFDDPLSSPADDDRDEGWGDRPVTGGGSAADLARFLDEKPPHHL